MRNTHNKTDIKRILRVGEKPDEMGQIGVGLLATVGIADISEPSRIIQRLKAHVESIVNELRTVGVLTSEELMQIGLATCAEIASNVSGEVEDKDRINAAKILIEAARDMPKRDEAPTVESVKSEIVGKLKALLENSK